MTREEKIKKVREQILPSYTRSGAYFEKLLGEMPSDDAIESVCNMLIAAYNAGVDGCVDSLGKTQDYFSDVYVWE